MLDRKHGVPENGGVEFEDSPDSKSRREGLKTSSKPGRVATTAR